MRARRREVTLSAFETTQMAKRGERCPFGRNRIVGSSRCMNCCYYSTPDSGKAKTDKYISIKVFACTATMEEVLRHERFVARVEEMYGG